MAEKKPNESNGAAGRVDAFEAAYQELQQVLERLQNGGVTLEESLRLFERGMELATACEGIVDQAELRVKRMVAESGEVYEISADGTAPEELTAEAAF